MRQNHVRSSLMVSLSSFLSVDKLTADPNLLELTRLTYSIFFRRLQTNYQRNFIWILFVSNIFKHRVEIPGDKVLGPHKQSVTRLVTREVIANVTIAQLSTSRVTTHCETCMLAPPAMYRIT